MPSNLNVGIVGCGQISKSHLNAWRNVDANIVAICDKNLEIAKRRSLEWSIKNTYSDVVEMVKNEHLDVVSICTPANIRIQVITPVIENSINVVIEKPFAMSVDEAEKIIDLKNRFDVKLTVMHNWLFSHIMKQTLRKLKEKEIGDILSVEMNLLHSKDDSMTADSSHWCHSLIAGRFGEMLPHPIYILRSILGDFEIDHISGSKLGDYNWMPIDELHLLFKDTKSRMAQVYISFNNVRPETTLNIFGTKGILEVNLSNNIIVKKTKRDITISQIVKDNLHLITEYIKSSFSIAYAIITRKYQNMHTEFIKDFSDSLKNNSESPVTPEEALEVVRIHNKLSSHIHEQYFANARARN